MTSGSLRERGLALHRAGRLAEAERIYAEVLQRDPGDVEVLCLQGAALLALRRPAQALASFDAAIALRADCLEAHNGRGLALLALQRAAEALASFERALALQPQSAELYNHRGNALRRLRRPSEALASYDQAIALQPGFAAAHNNRGLALQALRRYREAVDSYQRSIALLPQLAEAHNNLATVQCELGEPQAALESCGRALALQPDMRGVHGNRGHALRDLGRPVEALAEYELAVSEEPRSAVAYCNRGNALHDLGQLADAIASYDRALALDPGYAQARFNKSVCLLLGSDFARGLPLYESRKQLADFMAPPVAAAELRGTEPLTGRTLLVYADHGLGDTLQFCRYAPLLAQRGARVVLSVQPQLRSLLATLPASASEIRVIGAGEPPGACDYQCALLSLPHALTTTLQDIPAAIPYLAADPMRVAHWRERLGAHGFRVGIAWQGSRNRIDIGRSVPLAMFAPLAAIPGVRLISLQKESAQSDSGHELSGALRLEHLGEEFDAGPQAFLDSAAVMANLDLVITGDTALAHLAGALGRPAWVALKHVPDWRWLLDRPDSPWYPSVRLFRQPARGDWRSVFASIQGELERCAQGRLPDASR